jgi:hypothetical protein
MKCPTKSQNLPRHDTRNLYVTLQEPIWKGLSRGSPGPDLVGLKSASNWELSRPPTDVKYSLISRGYREGGHQGPMKELSCRVGWVKGRRWHIWVSTQEGFQSNLACHFSRVWLTSWTKQPILDVKPNKLQHGILVKPTMPRSSKPAGMQKLSHHSKVYGARSNLSILLG